MPASTPVPVMMHIPVGRLDINTGPGPEKWREIAAKIEETGERCDVSFELRTALDPRTFSRSFEVMDVTFGDKEVTFTIALNLRRLTGVMNLTTRKGHIRTI